MHFKRSALTKLTSFRSSHLFSLLVLKNECNSLERDTGNLRMFVGMIISSAHLHKGCKYSLKLKKITTLHYPLQISK